MGNGTTKRGPKGAHFVTKQKILQYVWDSEYGLTLKEICGKLSESPLVPDMGRIQSSGVSKHLGELRDTYHFVINGHIAEAGTSTWHGDVKEFKDLAVLVDECGEFPFELFYSKYLQCYFKKIFAPRLIVAWGGAMPEITGMDASTGEQIRLAVSLSPTLIMHYLTDYNPLLKTLLWENTQRMGDLLNCEGRENRHGVAGGLQEIAVLLTVSLNIDRNAIKSTPKEKLRFSQSREILPRIDSMLSDISHNRTLFPNEQVYKKIDDGLSDWLHSLESEVFFSGDILSHSLFQQSSHGKPFEKS
jgi:hypothetical protein